MRMGRQDCFLSFGEDLRLRTCRAEEGTFSIGQAANLKKQTELAPRNILAAHHNPLLAIGALKVRFRNNRLDNRANRVRTILQVIEPSCL
jgi:hypothetical protein